MRKVTILCISLLVVLSVVFAGEAREDGRQRKKHHKCRYESDERGDCETPSNECDLCGQGCDGIDIIDVPKIPKCFDQGRIQCPPDTTWNCSGCYGTVGYPCDTGDQCLPGLTCTNGACSGNCQGDDYCPGNLPNCVSGKCSQCVSNADCTTSPYLTCDRTNTCVQCVANPNCTSNVTYPVCNNRTETCVQCLANSDCKNPNSPLCKISSGTCVQCLTNSDCPSGSICTPNNTCVVNVLGGPCVFSAHDDCPSGVFCNATIGTPNGICGGKGATCTANANCSSNNCDIANGKCL